MNSCVCTKHFNNIGVLNFDVIHVPTGLPKNHTLRDLYDDRAMEDEVDAGTDTYWVRLTLESGHFISVSRFGFRNNNLFCTYMDLPNKMKHMHVDRQIFELVELVSDRIVVGHA